MRKIKLIAVIFSLIMPILAHADATQEATAISLVKSTISKIKLNQDETIKDINENRQENAKTHAIMIYDFKGKTLAWSFLPSLTGMPIAALPEVKDSIFQATQGKSGWYVLSMKNPFSGALGKVKVYYEPVNNIVVTSGFFE